MNLYPKDTINFLSKLGLKKIWNASAIVSSFYLSRLLRKPVQWGIPMTISIEPTTSCNLRCPECPSGLRSFTRPTGNLKQPLFEQVINELHRELIYLIFYFQGEPYINPNFLEMVTYAHQKGIYTITSTNGHFINDEYAKKTIKSGLDRLIISIDGTTQETYEDYRKEGRLEQVLKGARNIIKWKRELKSSKPHVIFQFLVTSKNEHQIADLYQLAKDIGIDEVKLKTIQVYDYKNGHPLLPKNKKYSRYTQTKHGEYRLKNKMSNHCWKLWHSCVITWDGAVVPCCFDKDAQYQMGQLSQNSLREIWQEESYRQFRTQLLRGRNQIDICTNCSEGSKIWMK